MLRFQLQVLLAGLSASVLLAGGSAAPREDGLDDLLGMDVAAARLDPSRTLLLKIVSDLLAKDADEVLPAAEELGLRREAVRQLQLSQRERKAGCRNFFWKTFTSC
ncbi:somatostatin [Scleropages formosus]|uniref:somatostatin n=1 Tax=Scleropages formosus TaxID=113540 RepID=UPI00063235A1|nr:somatostatin-like [Scleropages formosus]